MKITSTTQVLNIYQKAAQPARAAAAGALQQKDTIEVSTAAQSFAEVLRAAKAELMNPAPAEYISSLGERIEAGLYSVDSASLAGSMLVDVGL